MPGFQNRFYHKYEDSPVTLTDGGIIQTQCDKNGKALTSSIQSIVSSTLNSTTTNLASEAFDAPFSNGLTIVSSGGAKITAIYE